MIRDSVNREELSPGMQQYMDIKDKYPNELLFYRIGDFYELFFEDGLTASRELELTLTGKNAGLKERVPMCGVPFHSVKPYIEKLIVKGYKVAICEQLEDPKNSKGMVKRGVIQVLSKGSIVDLELLKSYEHSYIASLLVFKHCYILTYADISTGNMYVTSIIKDKDKLLNEILNLGIKELILKESDLELQNLLKNTYGIEVSISESLLETGYEKLINSVDDLLYKTGIKHLLYYLVVKELKDLSHIKKCIMVNHNDYLEMDVHSKRNLELFETLRLKERTYSLIWLLDKCKTAMGSRLLNSWLSYPLKDIKSLNDRYDKIEKFNNEFILNEELREKLFLVYDLERLCGKVICGNLNARDLLQIKKSISVLPDIVRINKELGFAYDINPHTELFELLDSSINEDAPITLKDGSLIKDGFNKELDELREIRKGGKSFIADLESKEREKTGIKTLKVGYTKVFGYYIEVSRGALTQIKPEFGYERRQTLTNCERFISPLLKEKEALVLNAEEKIIDTEYNLFNEIKETVKEYIFSLKDTASAIAELDCLSSLAVSSTDYSLVRPTLTNDNNLSIIDGRHPVVEVVSKGEYVKNSCIMDKNINTLLITGPNMAGKSTYMREVAIIIIMAQIGSFVPAKSATIPVFDKIFTRIGASDDLVSGESTFMVEMKEAKNAITNATKNSLVLFDELGRGTATYDGMSIAESILEYINNIGCKTLFSTHYHELTSLDSIKGIKNVHVEASIKDNKITFLHKVSDGAVSKSYGIHVAALAGMPESVINRANDILSRYENSAKEISKPKEQLLFDFSEEKIDPLREKIDEIDPLNLTPIEALNVLYELKESSKK